MKNYLENTKFFAHLLATDFIIFENV